MFAPDPVINHPKSRRMAELRISRDWRDLQKTPLKDIEIHLAKKNNTATNGRTPAANSSYSAILGGGQKVDKTNSDEDQAVEKPKTTGIDDDLDLFEWHCVFNCTQGSFKGLILHLILKFPNNYPQDPPKVTLSTYIPHSNIIPNMGGQKNFLCLDITSSLINQCWKFSKMDQKNIKNRPFFNIFGQKFKIYPSTG